MYNSIEITHSTMLDEVCGEVTVYGLKIETSDGTLCFPDLCTDKTKLERLCTLLEGENMSERQLYELFEDYLF